MENASDGWISNSSTSIGLYNVSNTTNNITDLYINSLSMLRLDATDICMNITLVIVMLGMGGKVEIKSIIQHLKRPIGIGIGMLCQFIILPLITFGFAHALQLTPLQAYGMLIVGCCPGGSSSNVFSYWTGGDVSLSLSITTASTLVTTGMMPLNLYIYSRSWADERLAIPYTNIIIPSLMTIGPATIGVWMRCTMPKVTEYVVKCGSVAGALSVVLLFTLLSVQYPFMYASPWRVYVAALLLPVIRFSVGYFAASVFGLDHMYRKIIAFETGVPNFPLYMTLLALTFPKDIFMEVSSFPLMYGVTCIICSVIFVSSLKSIQKLKMFETMKVKFNLVPKAEPVGIETLKCTSV